MLELNSWIAFPYPLVNNVFCFIFGGNFLQVGGAFGGKIRR
jgi:hypothetical protein